MSTAKFQSESARNAFMTARLESRFPVSTESKVANLESVILGLCIRNEISAHDKKILDSLFTAKDRLFIVKDNDCIYPAGVEQDEFSLCLVFNGDELNVCDLNENYPHVVARLENAWPSLLTVASRIKDAFETNDAALLINRTSGRIMASSAGLTSLTGIYDESLIGAEYSEVSSDFKEFFAGKKLTMFGLTCDEVHITLLTVASIASERTNSPSNPASVSPNEKQHRFIDELQAVGMHVYRFNALLETNLHNAIPPQTLQQVESVISEMCGCFAQNNQSMQARIDSSNLNACIRLMIQSLLMVHRTLAGESAATEILVYRNENNQLQIRFDTPAVLPTAPPMIDNEWYQLAINLSKRIGITIGELQYALNSVSNKICFNHERKEPNDKS